ncbi:rhodanese-related sulfurtransferase [Nitratireductor pacificus]|uniref:tRNA uridine(34) hydroxylase n=1 Tax=Nitratireductor pacificus pht-3B TaxID=391937 RepID=K2LGW3_9HYPH|nr:rhodanese-related sulfurtransferase [Nitratireductor pacificus]EKF17024.1 Rhodanese domain-containing protein [Nitratireductor pacificus pht-3B]
MVSSPSEQPVRVAALYRFAALGDHAALREPLAAFCRERSIRGTLLLAAEGINGTVAGTPGATAELVAHLEAIPALAGLEVKYSTAAAMPFHRMKVRLKKEIVTMGVPEIDPALHAGTYVDPADWNALIADPETMVIDTRNAYETAIGTFARAEDPETETFRDFPAWAEQNLGRLKGRKVAMFCTGGIRCEKATAFMKLKGIDDVYHLKGGILKYLEEVPAGDSLWEGECFVFDERVSVRHGLEEGEASLCRACRHPLMPQERASPLFQEGVSCPYCAYARSEADRARYAERQRQVELAEKRGKSFPIGTPPEKP